MNLCQVRHNRLFPYHPYEFVNFCAVAYLVGTPCALTRHGFGETPHRGDLSLDKGEVLGSGAALKHLSLSRERSRERRERG